MPIATARARLAELTDQQTQIEAQRAAAVADYGRGIDGAADRAAEYTNELATLKSAMDLEKASLAQLSYAAGQDSAIARRAAARQAATDALTMLTDNELLASKVDTAVDALVAAMNAHTSASTAAVTLAKLALRLADPVTAGRSANGAMQPNGGSFGVAGACAIRSIFESVENSHQIFTPATGLTLPVGERVPFLDAATWTSRILGGDLVAVVEKALAAEESLAASALTLGA